MTTDTHCDGAQQPFDYGAKKGNGQYEHYPVCPLGPMKAPVRDEYEHEKCGSRTRMGIKLALTYACKPGTEYYSATFCAGCGNHPPLTEFFWCERGERTGTRMNEVSGLPGIDLTCHGTGQLYH